ncbi:MAG TPA: glycosyltransferase family A protein [Longimicrobium sp.]|nr:glycosyltransferase family A protein [Longimicrobium sp.]
MPVRNALPYLDASIRSILGQTHRELELVIRDDASSDGSLEALRRWSALDSRIRLHEGREVLGPAGNSNWVVRAARGALVARMDADDISHPDRLRRQLAVLGQHPDVVLVGTLCDGIDARTRTVRGRDRWRLAHPTWSAPFPHGSVLFRREVFERIGGYREACDYWEDNDLFLRFAAAGRVVILPDQLYRFRFQGCSTRAATSQQRMETAIGRMLECHDALDAGRSYQPLLEAPRKSAPGSRIAPRVLFSIGAPRLWAGNSPGILRRLVTHGDLRWNRQSAVALAWAALATAAPRLLRGCLAARAWLRDLRVRNRFPDGMPCEWPPRRLDEGSFPLPPAPRKVQLPAFIREEAAGARVSHPDEQALGV